MRQLFSLFLLPLLLAAPVAASASAFAAAAPEDGPPAADAAMPKVPAAAETPPAAIPAETPAETPKDAAKELGKDASVATYERKSISYLRTVRRAKVPDEFYAGVVRAVRESVELPRFDYNDISHLEALTPQEAAAAVREYLDAVKVERAREQGEYDLRFKDVVITGADLRRIADSAYLYQPSVDRFSLQRKRIVQYVNGKQVVSLRWVAAVSVSVRFYRVDFARGRAVEFKVLRASGDGSAGVGYGISHNQARREAVAGALGSIATVLRRDVRAVEEFKLLTPVSAAGFNGVTFALTRREGLALDQGFWVYDYFTDGRRQKAGYVKVRRVGDGEKRLDSDAENIAVSNGWRLEEGQLLEENPQIGVTLLVDGGVQRYRLQDAPALGVGDATTGIKARIEAGYSLAQATRVSELYGTLGLHFLAGGGFTEVGGELGLDKRLYFRRLVLVPGARLGYLKSYFDFPGATAPEIDPWATYTASSFGVTPRLGVEFFLSPAFSIGARAGYRAYTTQTQFELSSDDEESDTAPLDLGAYGFQYDPSGLELYGGIAVSF